MERKNTILTERFLKYRKNISKKKKSTVKKETKDVSAPQIIYPGELDIQEELSNLIGYNK